MLEALAERNLADAREADDDLPGALRHLRRCRALAQRGRSSALEVDTCRRLSTIYSEIATIARRDVVPAEGQTVATATVAAGTGAGTGSGASPAVKRERSDERNEEEEEEGEEVEGRRGGKERAGGEDDTETTVLDEAEVCYLFE